MRKIHAILLTLLLASSFCKADQNVYNTAILVEPLPHDEINSMGDPVATIISAQLKQDMRFSIGRDVFYKPTGREPDDLKVKYVGTSISLVINDEKDGVVNIAGAITICSIIDPIKRKVLSQNAGAVTFEANDLIETAIPIEGPLRLYEVKRVQFKGENSQQFVAQIFIVKDPSARLRHNGPVKMN